MLREGVRGEFHPGKGIGYLADGTKIVAHATICATGVAYRHLNLSNEDRFKGIGVYYGAGSSEARLSVAASTFSSSEAAIPLARRLCTLHAMRGK